MGDRLRGHDPTPGCAPGGGVATWGLGRSGMGQVSWPHHTPTVAWEPSHLGKKVVAYPASGLVDGLATGRVGLVAGVSATPAPPLR